MVPVRDFKSFENRIILTRPLHITTVSNSKGQRWLLLLAPLLSTTFPACKVHLWAVPNVDLCCTV